MPISSSVKISEAEAPLGERDEVTTMNIKQAYSNWRRYRQTVNELSRMSDRELNDLGLSRSDIELVARRAVN